MRSATLKTDVLVIGGGLAGLVAAAQAADRGRRVTLLEQEPEHFLGGQAYWSLGGLFMVDTPEQRRMGIRDSHDLALSDWMGSAGFDREEDARPRAWAQAYLDWAAGDMRAWLHAQGMRWFPVVGWAERGGAFADGHGNSVPRFHITWGTGHGVIRPFVRRVREHAEAGRLDLLFRHRVSRLVKTDGRVTGAAGEVLADDDAEIGAGTTREIVGDFEIGAESVVVTSGGIGGDLERVRKAWPVDRLGPPPPVEEMVAGVPAHVDGRMIDIAREAGGNLINPDRMWHYTEGVRNWNPIWRKHGIRILPGPSSMWFDALGERLEPPALPGFDTVSSLKRILATGHHHSWFVLTQRIIEKEFALSGSEQNPDFTSGSWREVLRSRLGKGATDAVEAFKEHGEDFVVARDLETLVDGMNQRGGNLLDFDKLHAQIVARDRQMDNPFSKDAQVIAIHAARNYRGDRLIRTARPHKLLDPANGPLIAVKLHILTRKTLGGLETDLDGRMLGADGAPVPGLFAAGEAAGFGGGGYHGYNALEGTFLGGCIFSGRKAGAAA